MSDKNNRDINDNNDKDEILDDVTEFDQTDTNGLDDTAETVEQIDDNKDFKDTGTNEESPDTASEDKVAVEVIESKTIKKDEAPKKLNNKDKVKSKKFDKILKSKKFRSAGYSTAITAIFLAVVVVLNIVATGLENNFPLTIDLTSSKSATLSDENISFIETVEKPVEIVICTAEGSYENVMALTAYYYYYVEDPEFTNSKYYSQTIDLLFEYEKYNSNISVKYTDPSTPEFDVYKDKFPDEKITNGDILVMSTFVNSKEVEITNHQIVTFEDQYDVQTNEAGTANIIQGNTIEQSVSSAIYNVTSERSFNAVILGGHETDDMQYMQNQLEKVNYKFTAVNDLSTEEIPADTDIVFLVAPQSDYSPAELDALTKFLYNGGEKGKSLFYLDTALKAPTPSLDNWLTEWGFKPQDGIVNETDPYKINQSPFTALLDTAGSEFTSELEQVDGKFFGQYMRPTTISDTDVGYTVTPILTTTDTAVNMPPEAELATFDPESAAQKGPYTALAMSEWTNETTEDAATSKLFYSSNTFLFNNFSVDPSVKNTQLVVNCVNYAVGSTTTDLSLFTKYISVPNFSTSVTAVNSTFIKVVFVFIMPILTFATGFIIWLRRRRL